MNGNTCTQHCITFQKVSQRTFYAHTQHRRTDIRSALDNYIRQHNVDPGLVHLAPDPLEHDFGDARSWCRGGHNCTLWRNWRPLLLQPAQVDMDVSHEDEDCMLFPNKPILWVLTLRMTSTEQLILEAFKIFMLFAMQIPMMFRIQILTCQIPCNSMNSTKPPLTTPISRLPTSI